MANRPRSRTEEELVLPLDVDRARAETPGCRSVVHLNNAGASLPPQPVLDAVIDHLRLEASIGGYEAAADQGPAIEHAYDAVATLLGARREEIALVENATRAWDMAFYALPLEPGDRILTATSEYASNVIAFLQLARHRLPVRVRAGPRAARPALPGPARGRLDGPGRVRGAAGRAALRELGELAGVQGRAGRGGRLRAGIWAGRGPGAGHRAGRRPPRAPAGDPRRHRPRPRRAPVRHRHLLGRRPRGWRGRRRAGATADQREPVEAGGRALRLRGAGTARAGPRLGALLQHRGRAGGPRPCGGGPLNPDSPGANARLCAASAVQRSGPRS